ncbi:hypothetical protein FAGAP_2499 [Fusarium agapanthi]|uniref:Uncharacterized protein n=1 Tax=Fusarium agapanthi TaxID=1803897 RepID=A0A9P5BFL9_9HYPO|nr:hypothetical protein FAGAP_2499 [Fusarium agapanthi]
MTHLSQDISKETTKANFFLAESKVVSKASPTGPPSKITHYLILASVLVRRKDVLNSSRVRPRRTNTGRSITWIRDLCAQLANESSALPTPEELMKSSTPIHLSAVVCGATDGSKHLKRRMSTLNKKTNDAVGNLYACPLSNCHEADLDAEYNLDQVKEQIFQLSEEEELNFLEEKLKSIVHLSWTKMLNIGKITRISL